ncbi:MAG TPA: SHOCT domain-containing protein [Streptosporangiaceae bacterium]|nr:SHOCT domain-containing protein [Streptosporangiaceae bacterium]
MVMRPMMVRRRPLLRAAAIGGTYAAGRAAGRRAEQSDANADQGPSGSPQASQPAAAAQPGTPTGSGGSPDVLDQLSQLTTMHDNGALSDEEFAAAKAKVLGQ